MVETTTIGSKIKRFLVLFIPILVTQLALFAMGFFDTMMSGKSSSVDLAGVAIGASIWLPVSTGLTGILAALTPLVAQHVGAREKEKVSSVVIQAIYIATVIGGVVLLIGALVLNPILDVMSLEPGVRRIAHDYLFTLSFGIIPLFVYTVLRYFIDALGKTKVTMFVALISLPLNVIFNYMLIFGKGGFPKLGGVGAGVASAVTYWLILGIVIGIVHFLLPFKEFNVFKKIPKPSMKAWAELLKLGIPIGLAIFFETSIFAAVTLFMSDFDTATIAAHQAAMNFSSLMYMFPLSVSFALTILVGFEIGAKRYGNAMHYSLIGIGASLINAFVCANIIIFFSESVAGLYTNEADVQQLAMGFLIFAILFQLFDAVAAPIQGALRGYRDVNIPLILMLIAYWVIGLPLGYVLANYTEWGAKGYWIGLIAGLAFAAVFLSVRLYRFQKIKPVEDTVS